MFTTQLCSYLCNYPVIFFIYLQERSIATGILPTPNTSLSSLPVGSKLPSRYMLPSYDMLTLLLSLPGSDTPLSGLCWAEVANTKSPKSSSYSANKPWPTWCRPCASRWEKVNITTLIITIKLWWWYNASESISFAPHVTPLSEGSDVRDYNKGHM